MGWVVVQHGSNGSGPRWLKAELHSHCSLDPIDYRFCRQTPEELIDAAARLGYEVLAITCHNLDVWTRDLSDYAAGKGVILIPGMEVSVEGGRHVLVYNFHSESHNLDTLAKIRERSRPDTLVIAPHPFFPAPTCLRGYVESEPDLFDAVEASGFYTRRLDFNRKARRVADRIRKPMVGNGDVHMLWQLGTTYSWIYAEPQVTRILQAVRNGAVRVESQPLSYKNVVAWWGTAIWRSIFPVNAAPPRLPSLSDPKGTLAAEG